MLQYIKRKQKPQIDFLRFLLYNNGVYDIIFKGDMKCK